MINIQDTIYQYIYTTLWIFGGMTFFFALIGNFYLSQKNNTIWSLLCYILWNLLLISIMLFSYIMLIDNLNVGLVIIYYIIEMFLSVLWTYEFTFGSSSSYAFKYFILIVIILISIFMVMVSQFQIKYFIIVILQTIFAVIIMCIF